MSKPPPTPWKKGVHDDYSMLVVEVPVAADPHGRIYSYHKLQDKDDQAVAGTWSGGGQMQIAYALAVEAIRREALVSMLVCLSNDSEFREKVETDLEAVVQDMKGKTQAVLKKLVDDLTEDAVREALLRIKPPTGEPG